MGAPAPCGESFIVTDAERIREASPRLVDEAAALRDADRARVRAMMQYAEREACRWTQVRAHFGETRDGGCAHCDVCAPSEISS